MPNKPKVKLTKAGRTRGADYVDRAPVPRAERRGVGRPSKYDEAVFMATACALARRGATESEIADELGVSVATLYRHYASAPQFREAVKAAKDAQDERVENSLFKRATGYVQKVEKVLADGRRVEVTEHVEPNTTAQIFWLKNRKRMDWRDTREIDLVVPVDDSAQDDLDSRSLALAAINLLADASTEDVGRTTLDLEPNSTEEVADDDIETERPGDYAVEEDSEAQAPDEDFDPDFDR